MELGDIPPEHCNVIMSAGYDHPGGRMHSLHVKDHSLNFNHAWGESQVCSDFFFEIDYGVQLNINGIKWTHNTTHREPSSHQTFISMFM